jgi:hypothetical protein
MVASTLEREISILEMRSESLDRCLLLWIAFVVVGLVVEVSVVIKEHFHPSEHSNWKLCMELLRPVLITIGVAGELGIHIKAGHVNAASVSIVLLRQGTQTSTGSRWRCALRALGY